jgi:hypothetical protein
VNTGLCGANGKFAVLMVGQDNVDRIDVVSQALFIVLIVIDILDTVPSRKNSRFSFVTRDECRNFSILQWANAGRTATWARWPNPTTAKRILRTLRLLFFIPPPELAAREIRLSLASSFRFEFLDRVIRQSRADAIN